MGWDFEKTLSDVGQSLSDVLKTQYGVSYAKQSSPILQENFSKIVVPLIILGIIVIVVLKIKF